jgi:hypothetical protein
MAGKPVVPVLLALFAFLALGPAAPAGAQDAPPADPAGPPETAPADPPDTAEAADETRPPAPPPAWRLGLRLGAFDMINSADSYDAVYGDPLPLVGVGLEVEVRRWLLGLTYDLGEVDGEQVLPGRPPRPTGVEETLTYRPLALTGAYLLNPAGRWRWHLGAGAVLLDWEDEGASRSDGGSDAGALAVVGLRRDPGRWSLGGELRWSTIPDAVGEAGVTRFFGEDDLGGLALHLVALYRLR